MKKYFFLFIGIFCCSLFANIDDTESSDILVEKAQSADSYNADSPYISSDTNKPLNDIFIPTISPNTQIKDVLDVYDDNENILDLKTLLDKAKDNYTLQAKDLAISQAKATKDSVIGQYVPSIDLGYNFNHIKNPASKISNHELSATANWVLFDGAVREFSLLSNDALVRAAIADKGYSQEALFLQLIASYYDYFSIKGQIIAMEQKKINIAANVARIEILYNAGLETIDALESLKAELSNTEYQLESLRLSFEQTKLQLSLYTNIEVDKLKRNLILPPQYKEIQSLDITMQEEQAQSVDYQVGTFTYWPTLSVFDTYEWNVGTRGNTATWTSLSYSYPKHQNTFGVSVTWNIFSGFSTNRQKESLKLNYMSLQKTIAYAKEEQKNNIKYYKKSMEAAQAQIKSAEASLKSATISFENVAQKYNAQLVNYNDYLDSLTTRYDAESTYIQSLNNYELQKANYIFYSGQALLDYVEGNEN